MNHFKLLLLVAPLFGTACSQPPEVFDVVLVGGGVIDLESGLDAVMNVGLRGDPIARITELPLDGRRVIDAAGREVAPRFTDLHQYAQSAEGYRLAALDGVTAALELEERGLLP